LGELSGQEERDEIIAIILVTLLANIPSFLRKETDSHETRYKQQATEDYPTFLLSVPCHQSHEYCGHVHFWGAYDTEDKRFKDVEVFASLSAQFASVSLHSLGTSPWFVRCIRR
jgi:hypothetical protein